MKRLYRRAALWLHPKFDLVLNLYLAHHWPHDFREIMQLRAEALMSVHY